MKDGPAMKDMIAYASHVIFVMWMDGTKNRRVLVHIIQYAVFVRNVNGVEIFLSSKPAMQVMIQNVCLVMFAIIQTESTFCNIAMKHMIESVMFVVVKKISMQPVLVQFLKIMSAWHAMNVIFLKNGSVKNVRRRLHLIIEFATRVISSVWNPINGCLQIVRNILIQFVMTVQHVIGIPMNMNQVHVQRQTTLCVLTVLFVKMDNMKKLPVDRGDIPKIVNVKIVQIAHFWLKKNLFLAIGSMLHFSKKMPARI